MERLLLIRGLGRLFHKNLFLGLGLRVEPKLLKGFFKLRYHGYELFFLVFCHVFEVISLIFDLISEEPDTIPIFFEGIIKELYILMGDFIDTDLKILIQVNDNLINGIDIFIDFIEINIPHL